MKKLTEGKKMWLSVMAVFLVYGVVFVLFEDFDKYEIQPFNETTDTHLILFSVAVMIVLGFLLHRYAKSMDERLSRREAEKQAALRRELTQNIAHELKTPVAAILGYTETILENQNVTPEITQKFVERTVFQAKRLSSLIGDISMLNQMDYAPQMLKKERINVSIIVSQVIEDMLPLIQKNGMTVSNCLPENICINGNEMLVYSIFRNLLENSINYAGAGSAVEISAQESGVMWIFTFKDNGPGVDECHLERIFERFYRTDKSRSRKQGGTGLGLSIVKNAVLFHGGTISAQNAENGGLTMRFGLAK